MGFDNHPRQRDFRVALSRLERKPCWGLVMLFFGVGMLSLTRYALGRQ